MNQARALIVVSLCAVASTALAQDDEPAPTDDSDATPERKTPKPATGGTKGSRSGYDDNHKVGGPQDVNAQLEADSQRKTPLFRVPSLDGSLQPWFDAKAKVKDAIGLQFALDYSLLYQHMTPSLGSHNALGGVARVYGSWAIIGAKSKGDKAIKGSLVFKVESRHSMTTVSPQNLGFEAGYSGLTGTMHAHTPILLNQLFWQQSFFGGRMSFVVGRIDPTDYMDVSGQSNPWTGFHNLGSITNLSIDWLNSALGAGLGGYVHKNVYALALMADANGIMNLPTWFRGGAEFYTFGQLGLTKSRADRYTHDVHVYAYHVDERTACSVDLKYGCAPSGWGVGISANYLLGKRVMPFVKFGYSEGGGAFFQMAMNTGIVFFHQGISDETGFNVSWGHNTGAGTPDDQWTIELFHRLQLAQNLSLKPSLQLLINPQNYAPGGVFEKTTLVVPGVTMRFAI